ncbi:DUF1963 domain-containing protein [Actinoplanes couchii]|uniref:DUF1963 domain-containing protein n=1 Tax=Actinoplanes couchii TaxID=403638 RepID=A0ABQ3XL59_9ACTN|nr:DUF1963 domain-containing protein [Actinoplanes couchii]MDR6318391.1 hypothetical protein [Actinoplanes couchii]GID59243.1 hypothetical protein Aco03nite_076470 [Actinoplanes couchii]
MTIDLTTFRERATMAEVPPAIVTRLTDTARTCVTLGANVTGPVVGVFGGDPPMPAGMPDHDSPFIAAVDCALVPAYRTDVVWPREGYLLFFGDDYDRGEVRHVPPGTPMVERQVPGVATFERRELRMSVDVSLSPLVWDVDYGDDDLEDIDDLEESVASCAAGLHSGGPVQIGGYPACWNDPPNPDKVLLATFSAEDEDTFSMPWTILYWRIDEADLLAGNFAKAEQSHDSAA